MNTGAETAPTLCLDHRMILEPNGALRLMPASYYDSLDWNELRIWCHHNARYGLPTVELVEWLKERIGGRSVLEIGAGSGDLCHHLGIRGVDNHQQTWPDVAIHYALNGQPAIKYGPWVQNHDAVKAVKMFKPKVVIGSWITHWIDPDKPMPAGGGNMYGVKEAQILELVDEYIMIGNLEVHKAKPIRSLPHEELSLPFVKSRAHNPQLDRIFIWTKS